MPAEPDVPPPPAPEDAASWPQFTARLRALYEWCGTPEYGALCGGAAGLSPEAVSTLIGRNPPTRPPRTATERFVEACLRHREWPDSDGAERARWIEHWTRLDEAVAASPLTTTASGANAGAAAGSGSGGEAGSGTGPAAAGAAPAGTATAPRDVTSRTDAASSGIGTGDAQPTVPGADGARMHAADATDAAVPAEKAEDGDAEGAGDTDDGNGDGGNGDGGRGGRGVRRYAVFGAAAVAAALAAGVVAFVAAPAAKRPESTPRCQYLRGTIKDTRANRTYTHLYQCPNRAHTDVYERAGFGARIGVLDTDPSWFVCWTRGEPHPGGNDVWYYTRGDRAAKRPDLHAWGYVPASELHTGEHPDPAVTRRCPSEANRSGHGRDDGRSGT